jgi:peroxiredoxin
MTITVRSAALAAVALLFAPASANAALALGAKAPDFTTQGALAGKIGTVKLSSELKKGPVVLYFFPAAFTKGCSAEAHEFAEHIDEFRKAGATVIGMSADPIEKLADFSTKDCSNKFTVARADPTVIAEYDVALPANDKIQAGLTNRTSYVIAPTGRVTYVHSEMSYIAHVKNTLAAVQSMSVK